MFLQHLERYLKIQGGSLSIFRLCSNNHITFSTQKKHKKHTFYDFQPSICIENTNDEFDTAKYSQSKPIVNVQFIYEIVYCCPLFTISYDTDALGPHTKGMKIGILEVINDCTAHSGSHSMVVNKEAVFEEDVVTDDLGDFTKAFILLFGLLYVLNIKYPKDVYRCP